MDDSKKEKLVRNEKILFGAILSLSIVAALYLVYKAAFCFDPYYTFQTEGYWPNRILPCVRLNIFDR